MRNIAYNDFTMYLINRNDVGPEWIRLALLEFCDYVSRHKVTVFTPMKVKRAISGWRKIAQIVREALSSAPPQQTVDVASFVEAQLSSSEANTLTHDFCINAINFYANEVAPYMAESAQEAELADAIADIVSEWAY